MKETTMRAHAQNRIWPRVLLTVAPPVALTIALFFAAELLFALPLFKQTIIDGDKRELRQLTMVAYKIIEAYKDRSDHAEFSAAEAQERAKEQLRRLRFGEGGKDYFWIQDTHPRMVMHPYRRDLDGQDVSNFTDSDNYNLFREAIKVTQHHGEGFIEYYWQWQDDPGKVSRKLSCVRFFQPWGWIVGTGIYLDEFQAKTNRMVAKMLQVFTAILLVLAAFSGYVVWITCAAERRRRTTELQLKESEAKLQAIFDSSCQFVALLDPAGKILDVNRTCLDFFGFELQDVAGIPFWEATWWRDAPECAAQAEQAVKDCAIGQVARFDTYNYSPDGKEKVMLSGIVTPLKTPDGRLFGMIAEARDVTALTSAMARLSQSEARVRALVEASNDIIWEVDANANYTYVSPNCLDILGHAPQEMLGVNTFSLMPPEEASRVRKLFEQRMREGGTASVRFERLACHKDGRLVALETCAVPILDAAGKVIGFRGIGRDITERTNAELALRDAKNYLDNVIDSMPSIVVGVDADCHVTHWNQEAEKFSGLSSTHAVGMAFAAALPAFAAQEDVIRAAMDAKTPQGGQRVLDPPGGKGRHWNLLVYPLSGNKRKGAVVRIDDITERIMMEEVVAHSEKMLSVGALAAGMAHEINNPLGIIMQGADILSRRLTEDIPANRRAAEDCAVDLDAVRRYFWKRDIKVFLDDIRKAGERASEIVRNMMLFSRGSSRPMAQHDLAHLVDEVIHTIKDDHDVKKQYDFRAISIQRHYALDLAPVPCHASEIKQVLLNLLKNAAQAMGPDNHGNGVPTITIRIREDANDATIEVEDNGPGMDAVTAKRVFEPFFTTREVGAGMGLGLSVAYFIITRNHGGSLEVSSVPDSGAKFIVKLPLRRTGG